MIFTPVVAKAGTLRVVTEPSPTRGRRRLHPAWTVAAVTLGALVAASAFRSSIGVLIEPIEVTFGWDRATTSIAVTINLVLYGLVAPFAAALMERWGVRKTVTAALITIAVAAALTTQMTQPWQLWLLWGGVIGISTGMMALVFGAIVANRWFHTNRGLVTGVFSAANAAGQMVFLPVIASTTTNLGWRSAVWILAALAIVGAVAIWIFMVDRPSDKGFLPYGVAEGYALDAPAARNESPARAALRVLREASKTWVFWALVITFFVCGWSTNGLVQTHFISAAGDVGMTATTAAGLLAVAGAFDAVGTIASGWLTDRVDPRLLLVMYYGLRGLSLFAVDAVLGADVGVGLWVFVIFYGLDWVATVPPTVALCRTYFGLADSGIVYGWVFASHMIGAGVSASVSGAIRATTGTYQFSWLIAAVLCLVAAGLSLAIRGRTPLLASA